jgi:molybdopterin-guanine dinucleotide biosynthesis protein A
MINGDSSAIILAGGKSSRMREACFVTSCDVAFLNAPLISYLVAQISNQASAMASLRRLSVSRPTRKMG